MLWWKPSSSFFLAWRKPIRFIQPCCRAQPLEEEDFRYVFERLEASHWTCRVSVTDIKVLLAFPSRWEQSACLGLKGMCERFMRLWARVSRALLFNFFILLFVKSKFLKIVFGTVTISSWSLFSSTRYFSFYSYVQWWPSVFKKKLESQKSAELIGVMTNLSL